MDENSRSLDDSSQPQEIRDEHFDHQATSDGRDMDATRAPRPLNSSDGQTFVNQSGKIDAAPPATEPTTAPPSIEPKLKDHAAASVSDVHISQHLQDAEEPHDFAFGKAERQPLSLGGKRGSIRPFVPTGNRDIPTEPHSNVKSFQNDNSQHHVDGQPHQGAYLSDGSDCSDSSSSNGDKVIFIGEQTTSSGKDASSRHGLISHRALRPSNFPPGPEQKLTIAGLSVPNVKTASNQRTVLDPQGTRHSATQSTFHRPPNATASPGVTDDTAELLEIVAYKFRQKE